MPVSPFGGIMPNALFIFLLLLFSLKAPFSYAQDKATVSQPEKVTLRGYPVVLGNQVLFYLKEEVKGYSPEERAETISERIKKIAQDPEIPIDEVTTSNFTLPITLVSVGDHLLFPVFDQDAKGAGMTREQLAREYAEKLKAAMEKYRKDRSRKSILYGGLYTILATVAFIAFLIFLKRVGTKIDQRIDSQIASRDKGIQVYSFEIIRREQIRVLLTGVVRFIRIFLFFLSVYIYIHLVLSFFPWTRPFAERVWDFVLLPLTAIGRAIAANISNLVFLVILVLIARYILKIMKYFFLAVERGSVRISGFYPEWAKPTYKILSYLVIAFFAVVAFPYIPGSESPAFKGISIFLGVLFSLGSQSTISNMIAGFTLTYRRAFKVGDRVKIGDSTGDVVETRLQVTVVRTIKNEEIVVPNSLIMSNQVINYNTEAKKKGLILHTSVTIAYDAPWRKVHELLLKAARGTPGVLSDPPPFVLQTSLDDFYVTYELNAYTDKPQEMDETYSLLHQNIQDVFNEGGVEIMSPHYTQLRDGNKVAIPESYLPQDYVPGAFRILQTGKEQRQEGKERQIPMVTEGNRKGNRAQD
jgi:small-conductance mechanosensitive channel